MAGRDGGDKIPFSLFFFPSCLTKECQRVRGPPPRKLSFSLSDAAAESGMIAAVGRFFFFFFFPPSAATAVAAGAPFPFPGFPPSLCSAARTVDGKATARFFFFLSLPSKTSRKTWSRSAPFGGGVPFFLSCRRPDAQPRVPGLSFSFWPSLNADRRTRSPFPFFSVVPLPPASPGHGRYATPPFPRSQTQMRILVRFSPDSR